MSKAVRVLLVLGASLLAVLLGAGIWLFRNPLAAFAAHGRWVLARAGFSKKTFETRAGRLTYFTRGSGPVLVLLHGAGDQAGTFSRIAPELSKRRTVIVPDLAGHGESAPFTGPIRLTSIVDGVEAVLAKEAPGEKVVLVGNSLGAWAAGLVAKRSPDRVAQLVLVNGGLLRAGDRGVTLTPKNRGEARRTIEALRDPASPPIPDFVLDDVVRQAKNGPIGRLDVADMEANLLEGKLRDLTIPTDLVWGVSDRLLTLDYAKRLAAGLPAARLTTLPACGHVPQVECPVELLRALTAVLDGPLPTPSFSSPPGAGL